MKYVRPVPGGPPTLAPDGHYYIYKPHAGGLYHRVVLRPSAQEQLSVSALNQLQGIVKAQRPCRHGVMPDFGRAHCRKTGSYPGYPYIPCVLYANGSWAHCYADEDSPLCGTREEAISIAEAVIESRRKWWRDMHGWVS
jgi:hypothetical protein